MARIATIVILALSAVLAIPADLKSPEEANLPELGSRSGVDVDPTQIALTTEEQELVDLAVGRFVAQGLELPEINYMFHDDLRTCQGHKGMYHKSTQTLEMCSLDLNTMLHELAHAWANVHLTETARDQFVSSRGLDSWNDHDHAWERRGTEHVAETIAWALAEDPHHVKWVEMGTDGSMQTTHRIMTIDVDVDALLDNFTDLTGMDPVFRDPSLWSVEEETSAATSPEIARLGN